MDCPDTCWASHWNLSVDLTMVFSLDSMLQNFYIIEFSFPNLKLCSELRDLRWVFKLGCFSSSKLANMANLFHDSIIYFPIIISFACWFARLSCDMRKRLDFFNGRSTMPQSSLNKFLVKDFKEKRHLVSSKVRSFEISSSMIIGASMHHWCSSNWETVIKQSPKSVQRKAPRTPTVFQSLNRRQPTIYSLIYSLCPLYLHFTRTESKLAFHLWKAIWFSNSVSSVDKKIIVFLNTPTSWFCFITTIGVYGQCSLSTLSWSQVSPLFSLNIGSSKLCNVFSKGV